MSWGDSVTCDLFWRAPRSAEVTLLSNLKTFSPIKLLIINLFYLKKRSILSASNDNFFELVIRKELGHGEPNNVGA